MADVQVHYVDYDEFVELERCLASAERIHGRQVEVQKQGLPQADGDAAAAHMKRPAANSPGSLRDHQKVCSSKKTACVTAVQLFPGPPAQQQQSLQAALTAPCSISRACSVQAAACGSIAMQDSTLPQPHVQQQQPCLPAPQQDHQQQQPPRSGCMPAADANNLQQCPQHTHAYAQQHQEQQHCNSHHSSNNPTTTGVHLPSQQALQLPAEKQSMAAMQSNQQLSTHQQLQQQQHQMQFPLAKQGQQAVQQQQVQQPEGALCQQHTAQQQHVINQFTTPAWHGQQQQQLQFQQFQQLQQRQCRPWQQQQQHRAQQGTVGQKTACTQHMPPQQQKQQVHPQAPPSSVAAAGLLRMHSAPVGNSLRQQSHPAGSRSWAAPGPDSGAAGGSAGVSGGGYSGGRQHAQVGNPASQSWPVAGGPVADADGSHSAVQLQQGSTDVSGAAGVAVMVGQQCQQQEIAQARTPSSSAAAAPVGSEGAVYIDSKQLQPQEAAGSDTAPEGDASAVLAGAASSGRRKLPPSLQGSGVVVGNMHAQQQQQQQQLPQGPPQQQQVQVVPHGKPEGQFEFHGVVRYSCNPMEVDWLCRQMLDVGPPKVIGLDIEWRPAFKTGQAPNRTALLQIAYAVDKEGRDWRPKVHGRGVMVLLLHIYYTGITPALQEILQRDDIIKVGVNIGGDVSKLLADFKVEVFGTEDLSDAAHGRQLRCVEGITANTECKRWSLAGLVEEVLGLDLPKPHQIRLGNWERRPLSDEQKQYAALDAFASLLLHWELQALPERLTLSQQLRAAMRERAAAAIAATSDA